MTRSRQAAAIALRLARAAKVAGRKARWTDDPIVRTARMREAFQDAGTAMRIIRDEVALGVAVSPRAQRFVITVYDTNRLC